MITTAVNSTYQNIRNILENARSNAFCAVNSEMVNAYWNIGRIIVEEEQKGNNRAEYGRYLIGELSKRLTTDYGRGFDRSNLWHMKAFYLAFEKLDAVRRELTWTHYRLLLRVESKMARNFYIIEAINNNWSTRELERQINSMLFERLALSRDKKGILELAKKGQIIEKPADLVKDPYVLEFLNLEESHKYSESELEQKIIDNLSKFILEIGKGFMFVARQQRITLDGEHFYMDLVFYNRTLRCFVIFEIKIGELTHKDLGQLQMYVNYYDREIKQPDENPTIGILLCADKKDAVVRYTLPEKCDNMFASKYKIYLPDKEDLIKEMRKVMG